MNEWMEVFISQCLADVPWGKYRRRAEAELRDHMTTLRQHLTETEVLQQMGDPAELSRRYVREWRRRALRQGSLIAAELLLVGAAMVVMGYLYMFNTRNFGKSYVAYWSFAAIPAVGILLYGFAAKLWGLARWTSTVIIAIQLPPILCWMALGGPFEMSGVMVPGWLGSGLHLLFFAWGILNYHIAARFRQEERSARSFGASKSTIPSP